MTAYNCRLLMVKYYIGEEKKVVQEMRDFEKSIFHEQYKHAIRQIVGLLRNPQSEVPNLIAFCGDRGAGKTSCMMTVSYIIEHSAEIGAKAYLKSITDFDFQENPLEMLPVIDPAFFDKDHNVLELLLGQLYTRYKEWQNVNKEKIQQYYSKATSITKLFQKAKYCLSHMDSSGAETYDPLEELEQLSAGIDLSKCMQQLISSFLDMVGKKHLVIRIDDIDLNMSQAYKMCEQLRKYVVSDKCLVMISVKIEQLLTTIENAIHIEASYPDGIDTSSMASKYVDKLIPMATRVNMPTAYSLCDEELEVYQDRSSTMPVFKSRAVKEGVVRKIFYTSRYLFYNSKGMVSLIIPNNLRGLFNLLGLLFSMDDYDGDEVVLTENKNTFKAYFYRSWTKLLKDEYRDYATEMINKADTGDLNKYVINSLKDLYDETSADRLTKDIINKSNFNYNISLGDVLYVVTNIDRQNVDANIRLYLFFIKSFYSIRLYECYDMITSDSSRVYPTANDDGQLLKYDAWFERFNTLQKFVSGAYFTYEAGMILVQEGTGAQQKPRDCRVISKESGELTRLIMFLDKYKDSYDGLSDEEKRKFELVFNLAEYLILTVRHSIYERDTDQYQKSSRDQAIPKYIVKYNPSTGYYVFDILAIFYSVLNIEYAYDRFDSINSNRLEDRESLFNFAKAHDFSLLRKMMGAVMDKCVAEGFLSREEADAKDYNKKEDYWFCFHRLLSNAVIRNAEVAAAMIENIYNERYKPRNYQNTADLMSIFYSNIKNTHMMTYNRGEQEMPYYIEFKFLEPVIDLLRNKEIHAALSITINGEEIRLPNFNDLFSAADPKTKSAPDGAEKMKMEELSVILSQALKGISRASGPKVMKRIQKANPYVYQALAEEEWRELLSSQSAYTKADVTRALLPAFDRIKGALDEDSREEGINSMDLFGAPIIEENISNTEIQQPLAEEPDFPTNNE